jgi:uncharacterized protein YndB with AHSA1/START domain
MTVISTTKDLDTLTLTVIAEFGAEPDRVWQVWEDARQLERWWGPPGFPATFTRHDFVVGGESRYFMSGPEGERPYGWWRIDSIDRPHRFEFANGLGGDDGEPVPGVAPIPGWVSFEAVPGGTRMTVACCFVDAEQMQTMVTMGMPEGMTLAVGQIDALINPAVAASARGA